MWLYPGYHLTSNPLADSETRGVAMVIITMTTYKQPTMSEEGGNTLHTAKNNFSETEVSKQLLVLL